MCVHWVYDERVNRRQHFHSCCHFHRQILRRGHAAALHNETDITKMLWADSVYLGNGGNHLVAASDGLERYRISARQNGVYSQVVQQSAIRQILHAVLGQFQLFTATDCYVVDVREDVSSRPWKYSPDTTKQRHPYQFSSCESM